MANKSFAEAVQKQGGHGVRSLSNKKIMVQFDKLVPGCKAITNARFVREIRTHYSQDDGVQGEPLIEAEQRGAFWGPFPSSGQRSRNIPSARMKVNVRGAWPIPRTSWSSEGAPEDEIPL